MFKIKGSKASQLKLASWQGVGCRRRGGSVDENPYQLNKKNLLDVASLCWCRWLKGWLVEDEKLKKASKALNGTATQLQ